MVVANEGQERGRSIDLTRTLLVRWLYLYLWCGSAADDGCDSMQSVDYIVVPQRPEYSDQSMGVLFSRSGEVGLGSGSEGQMEGGCGYIGRWKD